MTGSPPGPSEGPPLDALLPYLMNRIVGRLNQNLTERLRRHGLTFQHWRVLLVLGMRGRRKYSDLIEDTVIPQSTLSRLVMRMERDGLLRREVDPDDGRIAWLDLTASGRAGFERVYPLAFDEYRRAAQCLTPAEEEVFVALLRRMMDAVGGR